jgi:hypothetical protein
MNRFLRTSAVALLAALALSGCTSYSKHGLCPSASLLSNTANASFFKDKMDGDPSGILYEVTATGVSTDCTFDKDEGTTDSSVTITLRATRTPTGTAEDYSVPYYLAVTRDGTKIISKQVYSAPFSFRPGEASTTFTAEIPSIVTRLDNGKLPYDYGLLVGVQMTQAQLDYNKKMGRFTP